MSCATVISPIEVLPADHFGRRRDWSDEEKVRIVEEKREGFRQGSVTAQRYVLSRSLLTRWRRESRSGLLSGSASTGFVPLSISPPAAASCEKVSPPRPEDDKRIEIGLPNGRRLMIPASLGTLPIFLLALPVGVLTDILHRRKFLIAVQLLLASVSISLMVLSQTGMLSISALIGLTFLGGIGAAPMGPTWQAIVPELVKREDVKSAVVLNSLGINIARSIGRPQVVCFLPPSEQGLSAFRPTEDEAATRSLEQLRHRHLSDAPFVRGEA